jgi:hypothetical protein
MRPSFSFHARPTSGLFLNIKTLRMPDLAAEDHKERDTRSDPHANRYAADDVKKSCASCWVQQGNACRERSDDELHSRGQSVDVFLYLRERNARDSARDELVVNCAAFLRHG